MSDVLSDKPMPITDGDLAATWDVFFTTLHCTPLPFNKSDHHDRNTLEQLRKVLEHDRQRVFERDRR